MRCEFRLSHQDVSERHDPGLAAQAQKDLFVFGFRGECRLSRSIHKQALEDLRVSPTDLILGCWGVTGA